jgi:two-component system sensor histidine kinase/response regulator
MRYFNSPEDQGDLAQLQRQIAVMFVGLTLFTMIFFAISDYLLGLSSFLGKVRIVYILLFLGCFVLMVKFKRFFLAMNLMLGLVLIFSLLNYFYNDGFRGPTIFNIFVFVVAIAILFKRPFNLLWLVLSLGAYLTIFYLETSDKISVQSNYEDLSDLFWDNSISLTMCAGFIFIGIFMVIHDYRKQNIALSQLRSENEKTLAQLSSLNEKKNQLIALLSHDLKGPVGSLGTTLELVEQGMLNSEDLQAILSSLKRQSFHLSKVLDNTLTWVISEMAEREVQMERVDLWEVTREMGDVMQVQASRKNQTIEVSCVGENQEVKLGVSEVKIILKNLLDNALKFSPVGENVRFVLRLEPGEISWEVINPGAPIPVEERASLFEFGRKNTVNAKREGGTGLGLSLCKKIADRLDMELSYSENEQGQNVFTLKKYLA